MRRRIWGLIFVLAALVFGLILPATSASAAGTSKISGRVLESGTGLPLVGVSISAVGPTNESSKTDASGSFVLDGLTPGRYLLVATLAGYENTESDKFDLADGQNQQVTLAIQRLSGVNSGIKTLGRTTIRASAALQTASVISATVTAQSLAKQSIYRAGDALRRLPGINIGGSGESPAPGDDIQLDIRGIGELETLTLIDGNPVGPGFTGTYNYELSPVFGLRSIKVLYGSGSDLYGVNAIGGVVDMLTIEPTRVTNATFTQGYGTFQKLTTALTATGSTSSGHFGYAVALGTQGLDGPFRHDRFYQASAAFDPYATDPAVLATGIYTDDTSVTNKSTLFKGVVNFNDNSHLTATFLSAAYWEDKTGNGDNDFLPFEVALANGQNQLSAARNSGSDTCTLANPNTFTAGTNPNGSTPGTGPGGISDVAGHIAGTPLCITPQTLAQALSGYQGGGPAWQSFKSQDYSLRYQATMGKHTLSVNTFSNVYAQTYDRTGQLPFTAVTGDNPFWRNELAVNTGLTASDDILGANNEFGFGYFWENSAYAFTLKGAPQPAPLTHDTAFFVRDAWHPLSSYLTTYANFWFKNSTITHTSFVDPRIAFVYQKGDNVLRLAGGRTSSQPLPSQIVSLFSPTAIGGFRGHIQCSGFNSVGNIPSSELKPEQAVDQEFSFGHRFNGDTTAQLTLYNENVFQKIYSNLVLPLSDLTVPFDPTQYVNLVASNCGVSATQALGLLGVSGSINIGHVAARGIDLTGR
ncbi:MAG: TonB-dependent receptor, partial [Candidatus Eremiobacteraeota bacterium]|nr:TonB-dependent receptor [Candidatus Eremiobacteraeota bacterium]